MDRSLRLQDYLHTHIPISKSMEVSVLHAGLDMVELTAPLASNINHRGTVFGGSLSTLAILSGWSLLFLHLEDRHIHSTIVIMKNTMSYDHPAKGTAFQARCPAPGEPEWQSFFHKLQKHRKARIGLEATLTSDQLAVATFRGVYVSLL